MNKRKRQLLASNGHKVQAKKGFLVWGRKSITPMWDAFKPAFEKHVAEITTFWSAAANSLSAKLKEIKGVNKGTTDV